MKSKFLVKSIAGDTIQQALESLEKQLPAFGVTNPKTVLEKKRELLRLLRDELAKEEGKL